MSAEVVWSPAAVADLDAIWEWIAVENGECGVLADIEDFAVVFH